MPTKSTTPQPTSAALGDVFGTASRAPVGASTRPGGSSGLGGGPLLPERLERLLTELAEDRASTAEQLVLELAEALHAHALGRPSSWSFEAAGDELERALYDVLRHHGWRGPVALFADALRSAWHLGRARARAGDPSATARTLLGDELGLWLWGREDGCEALVSPSGGPWNGRPLAPGRRLPRRESVGARVVEDSDSDTGEEDACRPLERGETLLVPAWSETVALALVAAQRAGLAPEAVLPEGAPNLDGRRMAQRLAADGVKARLVYDSALPGCLPRADRVWLGTEAIGVEGFAARVGTRHLLEEAARREVPALLLATTDKLVPGGALDLPAWGDADAWLLWEAAPRGVRVEPQPFERVPHELAAGILTEDGLATAAELSLSRLRTVPAPPCGASDDERR